MAEITSTAYQDLRDYIQTNWNYISLKSDTNAEIMRVKTDDSRVQWLHEQGAQTLTLELRLTGLDFETKPQKIAKAELYKAAIGGTPLVSETFATVTIEVDADKLAVTLNIQVPQVI
ncbi:hypothetical protein KHA94_16215 [Bacillus sp. FJAT-49705]|uniref:Uncharacterized protein n=1 Tax=Cytobacillus citreus TaxID=2833586 RepID=A0ABS5NV80_9BACI|nr:hypothetical protein [Cytobacillus citreus]MBS4188660.1 hypothetical protein [Cytobacillus citreus]MBS4191735.1 hypothetical protein [Cytobacillus citreus]